MSTVFSVIHFVCKFQFRGDDVSRVYVYEYVYTDIHMDNARVFIAIRGCWLFGFCLRVPTGFLN